MDGHPSLPLGTVPPENEYSAEKLAQIHAAMMEELGLGRLDTLHLADKGTPVELLQPLKKPKKIANIAIAAWHNLHLEEGADPTKADLDSIADGQLYRLRRGAWSSGSRGNSAPRGGHSSHGHRGGGRGGRGGYDHGGNGYMGHGRQDNRHFESASTPKSFYQNARENVKSSTHVERVMARLRGVIESTSVESPTHRHSGHGPGAPASNNRQTKGKEHNRTPQPVQPRVVLDNGDGFLKWAGIGGKSVTSKPSTKPVAGEASQPQQSTPHRDLSRHSTPVTSTDGVASQAQDGPSTNSLGNQGLLGSKWGPSMEQSTQSHSIAAPQQPLKSQDVSASQQPVQSQPVHDPPQTLQSEGVPASKEPSTLPSHGSVLDKRDVKRRNFVKIMKNGATTERDGVATMTLQEETDELHNIVLIDSLTGNVLVDEPVSHDAVFEVNSTIVTYRAVQRTAEKPPTWKIRFQLPLYAASFANFVNLKRQASGHVARAASDMGPAHPSNSVSLETSSYSAPDAIDTPKNKDQTIRDANEHVHETFNSSQAQYHPGYELENVPTTGAFAQDTGPENVEMLISLGDDGQTYVPSLTMNSDIFDLLEADDSDVIVPLFAALGGDDEFFDQMSPVVVAEGGKPASQISSDELMSDHLYQSVLQTAVARFLSTSESFAMLPEDYCAAYVQNKSRKIMELAISRRGLVLEPSNSVAQDRIIGTVQVEETTIKVPVTTPVHKENTGLQTMSQPACRPVEVEEAQRLEDAHDTRIKYSPHSLLSLRSHAVPVEISSQPPRERRPTRVITPHVTTVKEWQAFSATELTTPGPETRIASPSIITVPMANSPVSIRPIGTSSKTSRAAPTVSTTNSWQAFAAAEESITSAQDQNTRTAVPAKFATMAEPLQEVKSTPKASISTTNVSSTMPSTLVSPQHGQHTDDALWAAILGSVGSSKSAVQPKSQVPKGNLRHRPSKSDINDRLAKDFSGLNLNTHVASLGIEPATPVFEKPMAAPQTEVCVQSTLAPSLSHGPPLRSSTPAALAAVPEQSLAAPKTTDVNLLSTPESRLMPRGQSSLQSSTPLANTPASQAMKHKITAALKQPLVASPRLSPASSFTRPSSATAGPMDVVESQMKTTTNLNKEKIGSPPITRLKSEPEPKSGTSNGSVVSPPAIMAAKSQEAPPTVQTEPVKNPTPSVPAAPESAKPSNSLDETFNKVLKGAPGLSASKWADEPANPQLTGHQPPRSHPSSFQPTQQAPYYPQGPHLNQVPTPGYAPVVATVLVPDGPGRWKEVTGMVKAGSVPLVAHAPIPQAGNSYIENVRPSSGHMDYSNHSTPSNFPVRPNTFQHHSSFSSVNSESKINPGAPTFKPSPQRPQRSTPLGQRQPLSPSKNIQSQLQSRLNSSMTGPRMSYQGPRL